MGYWNSRGLRGSVLEEIVNLSNDLYRQKGLAMIQKIPTPITPVEVDNKKRTITLAYFEKQSTVDYIGAVQGIPVCFDAKETSQKSLPLNNIHAHQIDFMEDFERQNGVSFLLVWFSQMDEYYFLAFDLLKKYWDGAQLGGRKSVPYAAFDKKYQINSKKNAALDYLEALDTYLMEKQ